MSTPDRAAWLTERRTGIGGSDIASVFNIGWGCRRRLFFDKRNTPPDYPRNETDAMELGKILEPFFAKKYSQETGRELEQVESVAHPDHPELRVNIDRKIYRSPSDIGVLEIKSLGKEPFYKAKREGLAYDYILQVHHGMLCHGLPWGAFAVGSRDSGALLHWDVERLEALCSEILTEGPRFWAQVENGPMPDALEPDDKRCQKCEFRKTCHGDALAAEVSSGEVEDAPELLPLLAEYDSRKELFGQAEELFDETKEELKAALGKRDAVLVAGRKVYFREQDGRVTWDNKGLSAALRAFIADVIVKTTNGTLTVNDVVDSAPKIEKFEKRGNPFRVLRVY